MLTALVVVLPFIGLIARSHRAVALENLALRQQLAAWTRSGKRPQLRTRDRLFWVGLAHAWRDWRTALIVVQPSTAVRWHRQWLHRQGHVAPPGPVEAARATRSLTRCVASRMAATVSTIEISARARQAHPHAVIWAIDVLTSPALGGGPPSLADAEFFLAKDKSSTASLMEVNVGFMLRSAA